MSTILIGYDLNKADKNYEGLIEQIKALASGWWHHLDSTWLIGTNLNVTAVRDQLSPFIDSNDELLVLNVTNDAWASRGLSQAANDWLRNNL